jgi:hypothetical protein
MKAPVPATVTFRAKVRTLIESDGTRVPYIDYKKKIKRSDCNLRPHEHDYYNSDMFPSMLQRAYDKAIGGKQWVRLSEAPGCVSIDPSSFLAQVNVSIEV